MPQLPGHPPYVYQPPPDPSRQLTYDAAYNYRGHYGGNQLSIVPGQGRSTSGDGSNSGTAGRPQYGDPNWRPGVDSHAADAPFNAGGFGGLPPLNINGRRGGGGGGLGGHDYANMMFGGAMVAGGAGSVIGNAFNAAASIGSTRALLLGRGASSSDADRAVVAARKIQQQDPGISFPGAMQMIFDGYNITGNMNTALAIAPSFAASAYVLHKYGDDDASSALYDTVRAGEIRALLNNKNPDGTLNLGPLNAYIATVTKAAMLTGGKVGPQQALAFAKNASAEGILMNGDAIQKSLILSTSLGADKVGTGINALAMQFLGGKMSEGNAKVLHEEGLLPDYMFGPHDGAILKKYKVGIGQVMLPPGALKGQAEFGVDPYAWINDTLLPGIKKKYGSSPADIIAGIYQTTSRIPGGRLIAEDIFQSGLISRQMGFYNQLLDPMPTAKLIRQNDPTTNATAFGQALYGVEQALGNAAMPQAIKALDTLTNSLNRFATWETKHPKATAGIADGIAGVGAVGALGAIIGLVNWISHPYVKVAGKVASMIGGGASADAGGAVSASRAGALLPLIGAAVMAWEQGEQVANTPLPFTSGARGRNPVTGERLPAGTAADPIHTVTHVTNLPPPLGAQPAGPTAPSGPTQPNTSIMPPHPGQVSRLRGHQ